MNLSISEVGLNKNGSYIGNFLLVGIIIIPFTILLDLQIFNIKSINWQNDDYDHYDDKIPLQ